MSGLSQPAFEQTIRNISSIDGLFSRRFKEGTWDKWAPVRSPVVGNEGCVAIEASNRILTPTLHAEDLESVTISVAIDPAGVVQKVVETGKFRHLDDNRVLYYEKRQE